MTAFCQVCRRRSKRSGRSPEPSGPAAAEQEERAEHREGRRDDRGRRGRAGELEARSDGTTNVRFAVAVRVDARLRGFDVHVEVDVEVDRRFDLRRARLHVGGVDELAVAEDRATLIVTVGVALLDRGRRAALVLARLAVALAADGRRRGAATLARGAALRAAIDVLVIVVTVVFAL